MALDFQLAHRCSHQTIEEVVQLGADRRSLQTSQPTSAGSVVRILVNNETLIPQSGLQSFAQLKSTESGPFDLVAGKTNFTIQTSAGTQNFNLPAGRLKASQVAQELQRQNLSVATAFADNGHLIFTDGNLVGTNSFVRVSGFASSSLEFGNVETGDARLVSARGRLIYPGWSLVSRPDTITNRFPQFNLPLRNNPLIKVSYVVPVQRCLRCRATGRENDYRFDATGNGILIGNENLLYQASLKILLTRRGSNPYHQWYGTTLASRIGTKAVGNVTALLSEDVRMALSNFQQIQREQGQYQQITRKERLYKILDLQVRPHSEDPTIFLIDLTVQNASSEPISLSVVFATPESVALLGSNGLSLGLGSVGLPANATAQLITGGS